MSSALYLLLSLSRFWLHATDLFRYEKRYAIIRANLMDKRNDLKASLLASAVTVQFVATATEAEVCWVWEARRKHKKKKKIDT